MTLIDALPAQSAAVLTCIQRMNPTWFGPGGFWVCYIWLAPYDREISFMDHRSHMATLEVSICTNSASLLSSCHSNSGNGGGFGLLNILLWVSEMGWDEPHSWSSSPSWHPWNAHFELLINTITHKAYCILLCRWTGAISHTKAQQHTLGMAWCIQTPLLESFLEIFELSLSTFRNLMRLPCAFRLGCCRNRCDKMPLIYKVSSEWFWEFLGLPAVWLIINHLVSYRSESSWDSGETGFGWERGWRAHNEWHHTGGSSCSNWDGQTLSSLAKPQGIPKNKFIVTMQQLQLAQNPSVFQFPFVQSPWENYHNLKECFDFGHEKQNINCNSCANISKGD